MIRRSAAMSLYLAGAAILSASLVPRAARGDEPPPPPPGAIVLRISLGLDDDRPTDWSGGITPSAGSVLTIESAPGSADVDLPRWTAPPLRDAPQAGVRPEQGRPRPAVLVVTVEAHPASEVAVDTAQGQFSFRLDELPYGATRTFLDGRASVERIPPTPPLMPADRGKGRLALVVGSDGDACCAYVSHNPGPTTGWLTRFDGQSWSDPVAVACPRLGVWWPAVAVDGAGNVWVVW